ncbi:hypothetical protein BCR34DRAFT_565767 [Clohesyomyces aquaticus]|uniref:Uncharacterized protein n=1 Tax=Clohesyomyces aquaticus TaxID=1231657 RepID=A0A1Y1ZLP8_9PLEO|nr:hypothetical protein BCR34DRAFT_565767 [Clohesyomyces aquaticus]
MHFQPTISLLTLLFTTTSASALLPRIDGCPPLAPWPAGNPGNYWYHTCCAYNLDAATCCNRDDPKPVVLGDKVLKPCSDASFQ